MPRRRAKHFAIVLSVPAVFAGLLSGCEDKIPVSYVAPTNSPPPTIKVAALTDRGQAVPSDFTTADGTTATDVVLTPNAELDRETCPRTQLVGSASHATQGIRYFRFRFLRRGQVVREIIAEQFPDSQGKVSPTLPIMGTTSAYGSKAAGVDQPIWVFSGADPVTLEAFAMAYGWQHQTLQLTFRCPQTPPSTIGGVAGGGVTGGGSNSGGGGAGLPALAVGDFVEMAPETRVVGSSRTSSDGTKSVTIGLSLPGDKIKQTATFERGTATPALGFNVGTISALLPSMGGAGFDKNSKIGVVASFNIPDLGVKEHVTFTLIKVDPATSFGKPMGSISVYQRDPIDNGMPPLLVQPRLYFSPDSLLALMVSAPIGGAPGIKASVVAYDLRSGMVDAIVPAATIDGFFQSANVSKVGTSYKISVTHTGSTTPVTFTLP